MSKQNDFRAGLLLGITLFKFQYALPVALLFAVWWRWTLMRGFVFSGAVVLAISLWITGCSGALLYLHSLMEVSAGYSPANGALYGVHPEGMPNLRGIAYVVTGGSVSATHWLVLIGSAGVMVWGALKRPSLPLALLAAMLVSYHQVIADTSLLLLPVGVLAAGQIKAIRTRKDLLILVLSCAAIVSPTFLLFANTRFYLEVLPVAVLFGFSDGETASPKALRS